MHKNLLIGYKDFRAEFFMYERMIKLAELRKHHKALFEDWLIFKCDAQNMEEWVGGFWVDCNPILRW